MRSPLPGFPRPYRAVPPSPRGRGFLSGFADHSYALTLARFALACKLYLNEPAVLFFLRVEQGEQHFLDAGRAGGLELLLDSGLQRWVADFMVMASSLGLRVRKGWGESTKSPKVEFYETLLFLFSVRAALRFL